MTSCIVKAHQAGLFSLLNNVITCLDLYDHVHVDWTGSAYSPHSDLWPMLFEPTFPPEPPFDLVDGYPDQWLTYKHAGRLYLWDNEWRTKCHALWRRIAVQPLIQSRVDRFTEENLRGKHLVAALVRAHCHAGEQLTDRSQSLDQYASAIDGELMGRNDAIVYVAAGDDETIEWFRERFPVACHPCARRVPTRDTDVFTAHRTPEDAIAALEEVLIMSQCDAFVHPVSNMSTAALYMNPALKSVFIP